MSTATLNLKLDNAAFEGEALGPELARVLRDLADRVCARPREYLNGIDGIRARDINGNSVGFLNLDIDPEDD